MMTFNNAENEKLQAKLENLELPEVRMPVYQQRLRETLLASGCFQKEIVSLSLQQKIRTRLYSIKPLAWKLVASLAVLFLLLGTYSTFFTAPQAVASLALQVNPAVTMTISARNRVITAEGLDAQGQTLLAGLDLTGHEVQEALRIIADALREAGLLTPERRIIITLHPVGDRLGTADLAALSGNVRSTLNEYLAGHELPLEVVSSEFTAEFMAAAVEAGLLPSDYVDLVAAVGYPLARQVLALYRELGLSPARFKEELAGITEAMIDLIEEEGLSQEEALTRIKEAIKAGHTLEDLDGLPEIPEKEIDVDESDDPVGPKDPEKDKDEGAETGRPDKSNPIDLEKDTGGRNGPDRTGYDKSDPEVPDKDSDEANEPARPELDDFNQIINEEE